MINWKRQKADVSHMSVGSDGICENFIWKDLGYVYVFAKQYSFLSCVPHEMLNRHVRKENIGLQWILMGRILKKYK